MRSLATLPAALGLALGLVLVTAATADSTEPWPTFRGPRATGVSQATGLPVDWDVATGRNVAWSTAIPGLGHSSPVTWGDRIFLTTAVADHDATVVLGDAGGISVDQSEARPHIWKLLALSRSDGKVLWERDVYQGEPRTKRHVKSSQANSTPAADARHVVAIFGSQGMAAFDHDGKELWRVDLGILDPGLFGDQSSQWGYASSPVIFENVVIVQVDRHRDSFLAAYDLSNGQRVWKVDRNEKPVWSTPTLHTRGDRTELIVIGGDYDRGYDARTGEELWRYGRDYEVKTTTPFVADGKIVLSGGYRGQPIFALKVGGSGDLSSAGGETGAALAWRSQPGGPYTSTPVAYGDYLFFVRDIGVLTVLSLADGSIVHRGRTESTYAASPVAGDGKVYLTGEEGVVTVVSAEKDFPVMATNDMGESCMATPAITGRTLLLRCRKHLWAIEAPAG